MLIKQKNIIEIIGKTLNADRCSIIEYDKKHDKFLLVVDQYLSSDEITNFVGLNVNTEIPHYAEAIKSGKDFLINDREIFVDSQNQNFKNEKALIEKYGVDSGYTVPLYYQNELLGALSIQYVKNKHYIDENDINFIKLIANQVSEVAIYQARLYQKLQLQAERKNQPKYNRNIKKHVR